MARGEDVGHAARATRGTGTGGGGGGDSPVAGHPPGERAAAGSPPARFATLARGGPTPRAPPPARAAARRYARNDELGVPLAVTVDFDSVGHNENGLAGTVTLRERDSCSQAHPPDPHPPTHPPPRPASSAAAGSVREHGGCR